MTVDAEYIERVKRWHTTRLEQMNAMTSENVTGSVAFGVSAVIAMLGISIAEYVPPIVVQLIFGTGILVSLVCVVTTSISWRRVERARHKLHRDSLDEVKPETSESLQRLAAKINLYRKCRLAIQLSALMFYGAVDVYCLARSLHWL